MLSAQVRYRNYGLYLDGAWVRLSTEATSESSLGSKAELTSDIAYGTAALTYRLPAWGKLQADVVAGARHWYVGTTLEVEPGTSSGFSEDASRNWTDPIVGANVRYDLTKHWYGVVMGDVGGFGAGSDLSWQLFGGVGYQFTKWLSATVGYRYLHVDYNKDEFLMKADVQGFLIGVGFHF